MTRLRTTIVMLSFALLGAGLLLFTRGELLFSTLRLPERLLETVRLRGLLSLERQKSVRFQGELAALEDENAFLRNTLGIGGVASSSRIIVARVLTTRPQFLKHTLVIDQGRLAAIEPGMLALLPARRYVGRVEEVFEHTSRVRTVFHSVSVVVAQTLDSRIRGLAQGRFGSGAIFWGLTERGVPEVGQEVVSAAEGFGSGFLLGTIEAVHHDAAEAKFRADLRPTFQAVPEFVFLLKP